MTRRDAPDAAQLRARLEALPWDSGPGAGPDGASTAERVKRTRTRCVLRLASAGPEWGAEAGATLYAKRYLHPQWRRRIASLAGRSKALAEAEVMERLARAGFVVPPVVAVATTWRACYLVTRSLPPHRTFGGVVADAPGAPRDGVVPRRAWWRAAGWFTRRLWAAGFCHPDYYEDHVLVLDRPAGLETEASEAPAPALVARFALIDVDGVWCGGTGRLPSARRRGDSAIQFLKSCPPELGDRAERLEFLAAAFPEEKEGPLRARVLPALLRRARRLGRDIHLEEAAHHSAAHPERA